MAERILSDKEQAKERMDKLNSGVLTEDLQDKTQGQPGPQTHPSLPQAGVPTAPRMIPLVRQVVPQPVVPGRILRFFLRFQFLK